MSEVAIVTGGSGGIGLAIMSALRATGAIVISLDLTPPSTGEWIECDVRDDASVAQASKKSQPRTAVSTSPSTQPASPATPSSGSSPSTTGTSSRK
jgi:nucleoside-diphosphate-sugar epimerase